MYRLLSIVYELAHGLVQALEPILVPLCLVAAWVIVGLTVVSVWTGLRSGLQRAKQMHQIPCSTCRFFTQDYHLKCPVQPRAALSEAAIGCPDYDADPAQTSPYITL